MSWYELISKGYEWLPPLFKLNDNQFAFSPQQNSYGIEAYNTKTNTWDRIIDYPEELNICLGTRSCAYDKKHNKIYMFQSCHGELIEFDLDKQTTKYLLKNKYDEIDGRQIDGNYVGFVMVNDECHIFSSMLHAIYNKNNGSFIVYKPTVGTNIPFHCRSTTYLKSKNSILIFSHHYSKQTKVFLYSISEKKWAEIDIQIAGVSPLISHGYAVTLDDRYIFMFGWRSYTRKIMIYDVDNNDCFTSKVEAPSDAWRLRGIVMGDRERSNLITFGFIRNGFDGSLLIPIDIVYMIINWVESEYLHIMESGSDGKHWKIAVDDLLHRKEEDCV